MLAAAGIARLPLGAAVRIGSWFGDGGWQTRWGSRAVTPVCSDETVALDSTSNRNWSPDTKSGHPR
ncbi:MAG: hypothetical protein AB7O92_00830 [Acidimicrobiia bacterium]